jgi:glutamyl-tRNA synthetase
MGSAHTALFNWLFARHHGGTFVLRIEDTDQSRSAVEHAEALCEVLHWLGLEWDEGPERGGPHGPYTQMERMPLYRAALEQVIASGAAYPCYCTPDELQARREQARKEGRPPRYDGRCARLSEAERAAFEREGRRPAWRLRVPADGETVVDDLMRGEVRFSHATLDDFVIARSDGVPTYNFAVAVDDSDMEITHVLRADEHLANTPKQLFVYRALGRTPPRFGHIPMILAADRSKLSKRHGAVAIEEFRTLGFLPEAIVNYCALLGWSPPDGQEVLDRDAIVAAFDLDRVGSSAAVYDVEKLRWMNAQHLRRLSPDALANWARPWLQDVALDTPGAPPLTDVLALVQERVQTLADLPEAIGYFYAAPTAFDEAGLRKWATPETATLLGGAADALAALPAFGEAEMEECYRALAASCNVKAGALIHPTRLALSGRTVGPSLFALAARLGRDACIQRLRAAADRWA